MEYLPRNKRWIDLPTSENFFKREVRIDEKTYCNHYFHSFLSRADFYAGWLPVGTGKETC